MVAETKTKNGSYRSILKSTSLIGGASAVNILIGMVRVKFVAILLGPSGVGLMGLYNQIVGLVGTVSGMGLGGSGTRQVAEAFGTGDDERIARTVKTLRRTVWLTGVLGMLVMVFGCIPISLVSFGSRAYSASIALLGATLLLGALASGQGCILQGTRRISDIAKVSVIGAINGTVISIPCFYLWGKQGIVVSLLLSSISTLVTSWWFARRIRLVPVDLSWRDSRDEARLLLTLGAAFMGTGLVYALSDYLIRVLLLRHFSLSEVGIYQSAFNLSGVFVGFVLSSMTSDYFPRLTAVANDDAKVREMVNEQTEISILLALPGIVAMMVFAPLIIRLFYAASFAAAVPIMRWCIIGVLGRVVSWPLGVVLRAKGAGRLIFITELLQAAMQIGALSCCILVWGLKGAGIAFMIATSFYTLLVFFVVRRLVGAAWSRDALALVLLSVAILVILMINITLELSPVLAWGINLVTLGLVTCHCFRQLSLRSGIPFNALIARFRPS